MSKRSTVNGKWLAVNAKCSAYGSVVCIILLFFQFLFCAHVSAQSVSASLDRDKILLGEQVTLQFNLSNLNEATSFVSSWPKLSDTLNHTEILKKTAVDTIPVNGTYTYQQNFTVTSFDSGSWQLGPFTFIIRDRKTSNQVTLATTPLYLTVIPVDVSSLQGYHALKDIIDVETSFNWAPVIIAIAIILLLIIGFIIIKKRKKKVTAAPEIILKGTPLQRALEKLYALEKEPLSSGITIKKFHTEIDITARKYFEEMMNVKALQLTVSELFARMNVYTQDAKLRIKFRSIFELNAAVKFAKYMPSSEESKTTLKEIIQSLQQIDDFVQEARTNADRMVSKY